MRRAVLASPLAASANVRSFIGPEATEERKDERVRTTTVRGGGARGMAAAGQQMRDERGSSDLPPRGSWQNGERSAVGWVVHQIHFTEKHKTARCLLLRLSFRIAMAEKSEDKANAKIKAAEAVVAPVEQTSHDDAESAAAKPDAAAAANPVADAAVDAAADEEAAAPAAAAPASTAEKHAEKGENSTTTR